MRHWPRFVLFLMALSTSVGCCFDCGSQYGLGGYGLVGLGLIEPSCGIANILEPNCGIASFAEPSCGIAGACEPTCGIADACGCGLEPNCGIADACGCGLEPSCGIAGACCGACGGGCEPSCGLIEPDCGICQPCGSGCGGFPFGRLWNGWGPDWQAMAAGWRPCYGPLESLAAALRCGGCGDCYFDEWWCDPPRCCDPCPQMYGYAGPCDCGECGGVDGSVCRSAGCQSGSCQMAGRFHKWPQKGNCRGDACQQMATRYPAATPYRVGMANAPQRSPHPGGPVTQQRPPSRQPRTVASGNPRFKNRKQVKQVGYQH